MNPPAALLAAALLCLGPRPVAAEPGHTRVARWREDKACAFVLMFDDSMPGHVRTVVPALARRGLTGTFYVNPGTGHYAAHRAAWEQDIPAAGFELANHTWTHKGGPDAAAIAEEIRRSNEAIRAATPGRPWPRLVSWGQPGGIPAASWPVSRDELAALLRENHLVARPDFGGRGAAIQLKDAPAMLAHVDKAIAAGALECIIFHGVGDGWISVPEADFTALLDGLVARRDRLWVTGHIPAHQYATQRETARVTREAGDASSIRLNLGCAADPVLFDQPLTLVTTVPADWAEVRVTQGATHTDRRAVAGEVRYEARPGPILLTRRRE